LIAKRVRTTAVVKSDYDSNATNYDRVRFGTPGGRHVDRKEQGFVASIIQGSTALEVGTATGRFAVSLTRRGAEYTGVDLSQNMLRTTFERTNHTASVVQMDGSQLGFRSYFDYVLCLRTFHFMQKPVEALQGMSDALKPGGECLVTFETDNFLRRLLLFFRIGTSEQYYYKISDVEDLFLRAGFQVVKSGAVMRIPVTLYRKCPRSLLWILRRLERLWPWAMHEYVLGVKREMVDLD
jgi:ubiquinone/menaquinone biosynthesis C-methylase UbiE